MTFSPSSVSDGVVLRRKDCVSPEIENATTPSQSSLLYFVDLARVPWVIKDAALQATTTAGAASQVYKLYGENFFSVIVAGTASARTINIWGSHDGVNWVTVQSITTAGETIITNKTYAFLQIAADVITGGNVSVIVMAVKQ